MKTLFFCFASAWLLISCSDAGTTQQKQLPDPEKPLTVSENKTYGRDGRYTGAFSNGMKETYISFDVSGNELKNLTFKGYWRCDGKLEQTILGPEKSFIITADKVNGNLSEPEDGGATAIRYELEASFDGATASGTFRMNINALACDTYKLTWTASRMPAK
ncbi:MAG: hypothetical protein H0U44_08245 [Flavisolibacter sp.]|jgi:hypothetical protein|nr:hypothetical protein [Flavisolibacter sp.]